MSNFLWHRELFVLELRADAEPVTSFPSFSILKQPPTHSWLKGPPELVTSLGQVKPLWPLPHSEKQSWYFKLFAPLRALTHPRLLWKWFRLGVLQYYKNSGFGHLAYTLTYPDTTRYLFTIRMKLPYLVLNCHTDVCTLPYVWIIVQVLALSLPCLSKQYEYVQYSVTGCLEVMTMGDHWRCEIQIVTWASSFSDDSKQALPSMVPHASLARIWALLKNTYCSEFLHHYFKMAHSCPSFSWCQQILELRVLVCFLW